MLHRDLSTGQQIGMLLPVCHTMMGALLNPERDHENIPGKRALAGEAHRRPKKLFAACERMDKILGESARWGIDYQLCLEQQYNERHQEQMLMRRRNRPRDGPEEVLGHGRRASLPIQARFDPPGGRRKWMPFWEMWKILTAGSSASGIARLPH